MVVGSANFPESELLAEIYAGALKAKGVTVSTKLNIASRETYVPALENGEIDLIPEYTGGFSKYLSADADTSTEEAALASLKSLLPENLTALEPSAAQDKDSITVTRATADKYSLKTIEDLAPVAGEFVLGGPPEWKNRALGVPGLKKTYGLTFKDFKALDVAGPLTVQALKNGQVQAANLFTTDPSIKANDFVSLEDTKQLLRRPERHPGHHQGEGDPRGDGRAERGLRQADHGHSRCHGHQGRRRQGGRGHRRRRVPFHQRPRLTRRKTGTVLFIRRNGG